MQESIPGGDTCRHTNDCYEAGPLCSRKSRLCDVGSLASNLVNEKGTPPSLTGFVYNKTLARSRENHRGPGPASTPGVSPLGSRAATQRRRPVANSFASSNLVNQKGTPHSLTVFVCNKRSGKTGFLCGISRLSAAFAQPKS